jgi:mono/diheme cytochrome c family protein
MLKKIVRAGSILVAAGVAFFLLLQVLPIGTPTNPPTVAEPVWDNPGTRALAKRACFDCHSNETVWPWYAHVAPMKWLVVHDVEEGRAVFNFSDWHTGDMSGREAAGEISSSRMPLPQYLMGASLKL